MSSFRGLCLGAKDKETEAPTVNGSILHVQSQPIKVCESGEGPKWKDEYHKEYELLGPSLKKPEAEIDSFVDSKAKLLEKALEPVDGGATSMQNLTLQLNAEEELKRQSSMQGNVVRPSVSLQADGTNNTGSKGKHLAPRISSEANLGDDVEGVAADDLSNHNIHSRHMLRTGSMSPSSE